MYMYNFQQCIHTGDISDSCDTSDSGDSSDSCDSGDSSDSINQLTNILSRNPVSSCTLSLCISALMSVSIQSRLRGLRS